MFTDAQIATDLETMIKGIDAPSVPLADIRRKLSQPLSTRRTLPFARFALGTAAAVTVAAVALPTISPALQSLRDAQLVREVDGASRRGRYGATLFEAIPEARLVLGLDIGGRCCRKASPDHG